MEVWGEIFSRIGKTVLFSRIYQIQKKYYTKVKQIIIIFLKIITESTK